MSQISELKPKAGAVKLPERKPVHIVSPSGRLDNETIRISRLAKDEVVWFANGQEKATIVFASKDASPFDETVFHVPAGGSISSGPARSDVTLNFSYKYSVLGPAGNNDPVVIIDP